MALVTSLRRLAGAAALMLAGTAIVSQAHADAQHPVIGFTVYEMSSFISLGQKGAQAIAEKNGATLLWNSANEDVNTQVSHIQQYINRKVDAIIICPVNSSTLAPEVDAARKAGIPVFFANISVPETVLKNAVAYVGPDDVKAGEQEADHMVKALGGKGKVVVIQGPLGQSAEIDRTQGIKNVLAKNPGVELAAIQPGNWLRTKAYSLTQDWLSRYGSELGGIIAENDDMAVGAIQALRERGLAGKIPVVGIDGIKDGMRAVRDGTLIETNLQNGPLELGMAVQVAVDHLQGKQVPRMALFTMPELTKDNVGHYYDQLYGDLPKFISELPDRVRQNLTSGHYSEQ
ncbi:sugar ABC transporter substrate-binding periplasmic protein [Ameyamaea chiangmaiensis NBRC 103196]|uniref:Substrate-binding domain-containing protein n=1 Tax=Ameyamaea chiangmaiensis TaxID=442969 RepID=A0A850PCD3_9PROT|nr:substrate-binding domain-containing protein [Ameyamaea chiangmaiensis]MBS4075931.1 substrate-binding domain-containing protein [Ameyamaea chiangmaiensis]NVN40180.1 substrate-binding domain-containing protein [Ameyamaea chiangmaiensis]GBQ61693.1 sugar ABC transporter substrate-binding periplasmic protein [Ameyamaea chiangmaiensis NBRC 103196]